MRKIARFITRSDAEGKPDLALMCFVRGQNHLKGGKVYEIVEIMDELVIREVGDSALGCLIQESSYGLECCWGNGVSYILDIGGPKAFLTKAEIATCIPERKDDSVG